MFKPFTLGLHSKSFLSSLPSDKEKENNPNVSNISAIPKLISKNSLDLTEKMSKIPSALIKSQDFSKDIGKKVVFEKNKLPSKLKKKDDLLVKTVNESLPSFSELENLSLNVHYSKEIIRFLKENEV